MDHIPFYLVLLLSGILIGVFAVAGLMAQSWRFSPPHYSTPVYRPLPPEDNPVRRAVPIPMVVVLIALLLLLLAANRQNPQPDWPPPDPDSLRTAGILPVLPFVREEEEEQQEDPLPVAYPAEEAFPEDRYYVQISAFRNPAHAGTMQSSWEARTSYPVQIAVIDEFSPAPYKVLIGPFPDRSTAEAFLRRECSGGFLRAGQF